MTRPLRDLDHESRPRERLARLGAGALSDAELVALLLGTGRAGVNAIDLAHRLLADSGGVGGLAAIDVAALGRVPGVGTAKAGRLVAAAELGRRGSSPDPRATIRSSGDVAKAVGPMLTGLTRERMVVVVCDRRARVVATVVVATGSAHAAGVPVREVLAEVLRRDGAMFAVAHNHPGGDPAPSPADRRTTAALASAAGQCGLRLLDHVVIGDGRWCSALADAQPA